MKQGHELRRRAQAWNRAWNSRDPESVRRMFAPGGTYQEPGLTRPIDARTGIAALAEKTWSDWPDGRFEIVAVAVDPPLTVIEWRTVAQHGTGVELTLAGVDVIEWRGKQVAACRVYYDLRSRSVPQKPAAELRAVSRPRRSVRVQRARRQLA